MYLQVLELQDIEDDPVKGACHEFRISSNKSPGVYFVQLTFSKASI